MQPTEFISIAGRVVSMGPAGARTAISRAYYGAFHEVRRILEALGVRVPGSGVSHAIVPNYLTTTKNVDCGKIGRSLSRLHSNRIAADYDLNETNSERMTVAQLSVESALEVVQLFQAFQQACIADDAIRQDLLQAVATVDAVRQVRK